MKKTVLPLIGMVLLIVTLACNLSAKATESAPASTQAPTSASTSLVTDVVMAGAVSGDTQEPADLKSVFAAQDVIHAVVQIKDAPKNTQFKAVWYVVDVGTVANPDSVIDTSEVTTEGTRNIDFSLSPTNPWPTGSYRVEIYINDEKVKEATYTVQ
jgi:hypothetical protein